MQLELVETEFNGLRSTMARYGHSQTDLAKAIGVSPAFINSRFHHRAQWTLKEMRKISNYYGVPMDELFN